MKVKTSVTLSSALLEEIDRVDTNRSAFLERAAADYLRRAAKATRTARDLEILNSKALELNLEAEDVLEFQQLPI